MEIKKRFLNISEISDYLGFSNSAIRKWVRLGMIPFHKINGGVRFDIKCIDEWLTKKSRSLRRF